MCVITAELTEVAGSFRRWGKGSGHARAAARTRRRGTIGTTGACRICRRRGQVTLSLRPGRWRCPNQHCERQTFVERLAVTAAPLARCTRRVADPALLLGHTAGGRPGEMLMARLRMPASDTTIVRQLKQHAAAQAPAIVRVLGIDDWSWRKGVSYGTARWLARHPGVKVISRDRCGLYVQGTPRARRRRGRSPTASTCCRTCARASRAT